MESVLEKVKEEILAMKESKKESCTADFLARCSYTEFIDTISKLSTWGEYSDFMHGIGLKMLEYKDFKDGVLFAKNQFEEIDKYFFNIEVPHEDKNKDWAMWYKECRTLFDSLKIQFVENMSFILKPPIKPYEP